MKVISTDKAPAAIGPYSQAVLVNGFIYTSGQLPIHPEDGSVPQGIKEQTIQVFQNAAATLESEGYSLSDVIKTTVFLADLADFGEMNAVYASYFPGDKPARSTVGNTTLAKNALVEIEFIAYK